MPRWNEIPADVADDIEFKPDIIKLDIVDDAIVFINFGRHFRIAAEKGPLVIYELEEGEPNRED